MGRARKTNLDVAVICQCSLCPIQLQSREEGDDLWSRSLSGEKRGFYFYERAAICHSSSPFLPKLRRLFVCRRYSVLSSKWGEEPKTFLSVKAVTVGQAAAKAARFHTFIWREQGAFTSVMLGSIDEWRAGRER